MKTSINNEEVIKTMKRPQVYIEKALTRLNTEKGKRIKTNKEPIFCLSKTITGLVGV